MVSTFEIVKVGTQQFVVANVIDTLNESMLCRTNERKTKNTEAINKIMNNDIRLMQSILVPVRTE